MNKVVLVTGSSRGIGKSTIIEFAKNGYNVVINYVESKKAVDKLKLYVEKQFKVKALTIKADVSNENQVKQMISEVISKFGRLDAVVNNAGIVYDRSFNEITIEQFRRTLDVNVIGAFIVAREASKYLKSGATIVNVSSTNGTKTISPECLDYNVSKIGLQSLTRDLAFQFKPHIRVNAIAIGWADTDMNKDLPKDYIEAENEKIWLGKFAKPEQIAETIYFLSSEKSSYINGEIITIDGGYC
jgi:3-oxoacyl-[acyl-carrier protein] reductase